MSQAVLRHWMLYIFQGEYSGEVGARACVLQVYLCRWNMPSYIDCFKSYLVSLTCTHVSFGQPEVEERRHKCWPVWPDAETMSGSSVTAFLSHALHAGTPPPSTQTPFSQNDHPLTFWGTLLKLFIYSPWASFCHVFAWVICVKVGGNCNSRQVLPMQIQSAWIYIASVPLTCHTPLNKPWCSLRPWFLYAKGNKGVKPGL